MFTLVRPQPKALVCGGSPGRGRWQAVGLQFCTEIRDALLKSSCIAQKSALLFGHGSRKRSRRGAQPRFCLKQKVHLSHCAACQGCLLHPPPLVDLARDRKISGFFFVRRPRAWRLGFCHPQGSRRPCIISSFCRMHVSGRGWQARAAQTSWLPWFLRGSRREGCAVASCFIRLHMLILRIQVGYMRRS